MARRRPFLGIIAVGILSLAAGARGVWWFTDIGFTARVRLASWRGYDGCLCDDCLEHFGIGPRGWHAHHAAEIPTPPQAAWLGVAAGVVLILTGVLPIWWWPSTRGRSAQCAHCKYDLTGAPRSPACVCPECGSTAAWSLRSARCPSCSYDLQGARPTPALICPECGKAHV